MAVINVWATVRFKVFHEDAIDPNVDKLREVMEDAGFLYDAISWEHEEADDL